MPKISWKINKTEKLECSHSAFVYHFIYHILKSKVMYILRKFSKEMAKENYVWEHIFWKNRVTHIISNSCPRIWCHSASFTDATIVEDRCHWQLVPKTWFKALIGIPNVLHSLIIGKSGASWISTLWRIHISLKV